LNEWPKDTPLWLLEAFDDMDAIARRQLADPKSGVSPERGAGYLQCLETLRSHVSDQLFEEGQARQRAMAAMEKARQESAAS
jgi:hypothetical protein